MDNKKKARGDKEKQDRPSKKQRVVEKEDKPVKQTVVKNKEEDEEQDIKTDVKIAVAKEAPGLLRALKTYGPFVVHEPIKDGYPHMVLVENVEQCDTILQVLVMSFFNIYDDSVIKRKDIVLGFDLEFYQKEPVTVQLSTEKLAAVIHFAKFEGGMPSSLKALLESGECIKAGVGVPNDAMALKIHFGIKMRGILDVGLVACDILGGYYKLEDLSVDLLNIPKRGKSFGIKGKTITLSKDQTEYAAIDAWIGYRLAQYLFDAMGFNEKSMYNWCKSKETGNKMSAGLQQAAKERQTNKEQQTNKDSQPNKDGQPKKDSKREAKRRKIAPHVAELRARRKAQVAHHINKEKLTGVFKANKSYKQTEDATLDLVSAMYANREKTSTKITSKKADPDDDLILNFV